MRLVSFIFLGGLLGAAVPSSASAQTPDPEFGAAAGQYIACMVMTVRMDCFHRGVWEPKSYRNSAARVN